jgi:hypothetical protein
MIFCISASNNIVTLVSDVSTSFKKLQAEKLAADAVLREVSPLESIQDVDALRDYLQNLALKTEVRSIYEGHLNIITNVRFLERYLRMKSSV